MVINFHIGGGENGRGELTQQFAELDLWQSFQPEPEECYFTALFQNSCFLSEHLGTNLSRVSCLSLRLLCPFWCL